LDDDAEDADDDDDDDDDDDGLEHHLIAKTCSGVQQEVRQGAAIRSNHADMHTILSTVPQNIRFLGIRDTSKVCGVPRYSKVVPALRETNVSILGHSKNLYMTLELTLVRAGFKHYSSETANPKTLRCLQFGKKRVSNFSLSEKQGTQFQSFLCPTCQVRVSRF
jgi:hypothetical protein